MSLMLLAAMLAVCSTVYHKGGYNVLLHIPSLNCYPLKGHTTLRREVSVYHKERQKSESIIEFWPCHEGMVPCSLFHPFQEQQSYLESSPPTTAEYVRKWLAITTYTFQITFSCEKKIIGFYIIV